MGPEQVGDSAISLRENLPVATYGNTHDDTAFLRHGNRHLVFYGNQAVKVLVEIERVKLPSREEIGDLVGGNVAGFAHIVEHRLLVRVLQPERKELGHVIDQGIDLADAALHG